MDKTEGNGGTTPPAKETLVLPTVVGVEEVQLSPQLLEQLGRSARDSMLLNTPGMNFIGIRYYVSDEVLEVVCDNIDFALKEAGFKPLSAKARLHSGSKAPFGAYTKPGGPDLLLTVNFAKKVLESFQSKPGKPDNPMLEFMRPLETKKYAVTVIGARGMAARLGRFINQKF